MKTSVILSTYNQPEWLRKTILGYIYQDTHDFEIIIADDGSGEETRQVIEEFQFNSPFPIKHVWHHDEGFRKSTILNKAIIFSQSDYLIFSVATAYRAMILSQPTSRRHSLTTSSPGATANFL